MKRKHFSAALSLALATALTLSACGEAVPPEPSSETVYEPRYVAQAELLSDQAYPAASYGGALYYVAWSEDDVRLMEYAPGSEPRQIAELASGCRDICAAENGVWLLYAQDESYSAELYAYSGELLASVELDEYRADLEYPFVGGLAADAEHVYFDCLSVVFIFDNTGAYTGSVPFEDRAAVLGIAAAEGEAVLLLKSGNGFSRLARVSPEELAVTGEFELDFKLEYIYGGGGVYDFVGYTGSGVCACTLEGWAEQLFDYAELGFDMSGPMKPCPLAEEDLLVVDAFGASGVGLWRCRMSEEPLPARKKLSLELLGGAVGDISGCVARFNAQSAEYYVETTDLTAAFTVIDDRLLDLYALIDAEFSREDFVALRAFESGGALYSVAPCFDVSTYVGLERLVGEGTGWTFEDYSALAASLSPGQKLLEIISPEIFLQNSLNSFLPTVMDYSAAECSFTDGRFEALLEQAASAKTAEQTDVAGLVGRFTSGETVLMDSVLRGVYDLAALENTAGGSVTAIGWPTQGGECGSELLASSDIAICAAGDTAGAWAFLKFCLSDAQLQEQLATTSFPISRAALEARLAECQARQEDAMSAAQAEKLRALLDALVYKSAADYSVTGIVLEEAGAYFAGERSSAETAELVQDRISTYLSERYG
uniref:hypothetical protein n=1 Tax=Candidatus Scatomorpha intestinigallinarum TaxID=2840923 RepID=UPI0040256F21